jgi:lipoprotein Spr
MLKNLLIVSGLVLLLASCTSIKPVASANGRQANNTIGARNNNEVKFLDDISTEGASTEIPKETAKKSVPKKQSTLSYDNQDVEYAVTTSHTTARIESASSLQFKYAVLMNTDVEQVQNLSLYQSIDEWYGTRYRMGGTTKKGIDCSALVQIIFESAFGLNIPRTAREQFKASQRVSRTELQEGDLLFFNTRGGISHVGIYLQNNKFLHASVSGGVMISDMFDPYFVRRFISAGRIIRETALSTGKP